MEDLFENFLCPCKVIHLAVDVSERFKSFYELITLDGLVKLHNDLEILNCGRVVFQLEAGVGHREIHIQAFRQGLQSPQIGFLSSLIIRETEVGVAEVEISLAG